jgi:hypothetical protein
MGWPTAPFFGSARAQPDTKLIGPRPARHGARAVPGLTSRHVGRPGTTRLSCGPIRHVGRPGHGRPAKAREPERLDVYIVRAPTGPQNPSATTTPSQFLPPHPRPRPLRLPRARALVLPPGRRRWCRSAVAVASSASPRLDPVFPSLLLPLCSPDLAPRWSSRAVPQNPSAPGPPFLPRQRPLLHRALTCGPRPLCLPHLAAVTSVDPPLPSPPPPLLA